MQKFSAQNVKNEEVYHKKLFCYKLETAITSPINISHFQQEEAGPLVEADPEEPDGDRDHVPALELHSVNRSG